MTASPTNREGFLDTSYAIALSAPTDQFHTRASTLAARMSLIGVKFVTTRAVLMEIGNALARQRYREACMKLLRSFEADPSVEVLPLSENLYQQAFDLYCSRPDKDWGLIDCASFAVMTDRGLNLALTADQHFQQARFVAMLRDGN